jgi:hypothetical protein
MFSRTHTHTHTPTYVHIVMVMLAQQYSLVDIENKALPTFWVPERDLHFLLVSGCFGCNAVFNFSEFLWSMLNLFKNDVGENVLLWCLNRFTCRNKLSTCILYVYTMYLLCLFRQYFIGEGDSEVHVFLKQ